MRAANDLLTNYQHVIDDLSLKTGTAGVFDVEVSDGDRHEMIYSKAETGRHDNDGEVLSLFTEFVGPDVARYGT